jgi:hypothetical protein
MAISALPLFSGTAPNRAQSQSDFNVNMANWISYTTTFQVSYNAFATQANALAVEVNGYAEDAAEALADTESVRDDAVIAKDAAEAAANFKGAWASLTGALNKPATVSHVGGFWALINNLPNVTTSAPSPTNADWQFVSGTRWQPTKTASFTVPVNTMQSILATGSAADATLTASAPDGTFFVIANSAASTQLVRIVNAGYTIRNNRRSITSADNIILSAGQTAYLRAISTTILEVVING